MKLIELAARSCAALGCALLLAACGGADDAGPVHEPVPMPDPTPIDYPVELWDLRVTGETEVLIHVNEFGNVDSALVSRSSGYSQFDSAAVGGARRLRFTPGRRGDRHVAMWTKIPVRFAQDSSATVGAPSPAGPRDE
jgi:TonB family protein